LLWWIWVWWCAMCLFKIKHVDLLSNSFDDFSPKVINIHEVSDEDKNEKNNWKKYIKPLISFFQLDNICHVCICSKRKHSTPSWPMVPK
jgi:dolichyl-phosphate-mannose--protein O-mannosyl transferase